MRLRNRHFRGVRVSHLSSLLTQAQTYISPPSVPYTSAVSLTTSEYYHETYPVTRAEYLEHGSSICRRRFGGPAYNVAPPGFLEGEIGGDVSDDERERRYALGLESIRGKGSKGKRKVEEQEVTSGNWGGRRRRGVL